MNRNRPSTRSTALALLLGSWLVAPSSEAATLTIDLTAHEADAHASCLGVFVSAGSSLGTRERVSVGDLDGDGRADMVVGAPLEGAVHVLLGEWSGERDLGGDPSEIVILGDADEHFGAVTAVGDLNGDGQDDLAFSVPLASGPGHVDREAGEVIILFGPFDAGTVVDLNSVTPDVTLRGRDVQGRLGEQSLALGDLNDDGYLDLITIAARVRESGVLVGGEGYVLFGPFGGTPLIDLGAGGGNVLFRGGGSNLDRAEIRVNDLNGDGLADLVLGLDLFNPPTPSPWAGAVRVFFGPFPVGAPLEVGGSSGLLIFDTALSALGFSIDLADVSGNGSLDIVMGAPLSDVAGTSNAGALVVVAGPFEPGVLDLEVSPPLVSILGQRTFDVAGWTVAAGDLSGDGVVDLVVGARREVFVYCGPFTPGSTLEAAAADVNVILDSTKSFALVADVMDDPTADLVLLGPGGGVGTMPDCASVHVLALAPRVPHGPSSSLSAVSSRR